MITKIMSTASQRNWLWTNKNNDNLTNKNNNEKPSKNEQLYHALFYDGFLYCKIHDKIYGYKWIFIIGYDKHDFTFEHEFDKFLIVKCYTHDISNISQYILGSSKTYSLLGIGAEYAMFELLKKYKPNVNENDKHWNRIDLIFKYFRKNKFDKLIQLDSEQVRELLIKDMGEFNE